MENLWATRVKSQYQSGIIVEVDDPQQEEIHRKFHNARSQMEEDL